MRTIIKSLPLILFIILFLGCVQPVSTVSPLGDNNAPIIEVINVDPPLISVGTTAKIKVIANDPDGDQLKYSWSTVLGDIIGSGSEVRYSAAFCCVGSNTITVVVTDARGASITQDIRIEINL